MSNASNATVDEKTIFSLGSITKVFTTTLLAEMVNKGLINLDDPIEKFLPPMLLYCNTMAIKSPSRI